LNEPVESLLHRLALLGQLASRVFRQR
jgi:hypothetical protein